MLTLNHASGFGSSSTLRGLTSENYFYRIANPLDIFGWCSSASDINCTISRDATVTDSPYGGTPLKMACTSNSGEAFIDTYSNSVWNIAAASSGQTWQVKVYAKANVATTGELFIFGVASTGGYFSTDNNTFGSSGAFNIGTVWNEHTFAFTPIRTVSPFITNVQIRLDGPQTNGSGVNIWWDGLQLYRLS
jgi:hypothetical protein